ncbi:mandelate racemase/muconate lactonizing enzyme family protein [Mesorhizobium sp. J8]|uniref:mandelate racemase/muconate lactonizing enzyme family protein n=1 Tax=Mesorhizobium sp. J8 TaxID=2777475 RepID=UPI001915FD34|nr:mandelate racemase/muconate lactonizing enzyme family protein [Mesorhizobium sp. J8]BCM17730.1 mandelate racemase [Mesorhizobium sp. J8]
MKIRRIRVFMKSLPVPGGKVTVGQATLAALDSTIIQIISDSGVVGWGETCPIGPTYAQSHALGARAAIMEMSPGLIGASINPGLLHRKMNSLLNGHSYAKAAFDIAAHDLIGKHTGMRVADLLGGATTERVPFYFFIGVGDADEVVRSVKEAQASGYVRIQTKIGGRPVDQDIEVIRKVAEVLKKGMRWAVDGNRNLTMRDAILLSQQCRDIPFVLEQPCNTLDEIAAIRPALQHPIYIDESGLDLSTVVQAAGNGLCDGFGMKVTRIGGLKPMAAFRDICEARSLPHTSDDSWGGDITGAACVHIGSTVRPNLFEGCSWVNKISEESHYDPIHPISVTDGHVLLPTGPGLGLEVDESMVGTPIAEF